MEFPFIALEVTRGKPKLFCFGESCVPSRTSSISCNLTNFSFWIESKYDRAKSSKLAFSSL